MAVIYADSSALVKLVLPENESEALRTYLRGVDLTSSELVLTEVPRAMHRAVALDPSQSVELLIKRASELIETIALRPLDRALLLGAGAIAEPALRSLDAIHVASAVSLDPLAAFVTYDVRQAAAARLAGLRTMAPGV
jgi:predicted nucleic acid-binding protein